MAVTAPDRPRTRRWRSRAFVQPLLITIVGVVGSVGLYYSVRGPTGLPCTFNADSCGYVWMGAIGQAVAALPALLVGLLITGLVVGLLSHNAGLALRAVVVGVMVPPLGGALALALQSVLASGDADKLVQYPAVLR